MANSKKVERIFLRKLLPRKEFLFHIPASQSQFASVLYSLRPQSAPADEGSSGIIEVAPTSQPYRASFASPSSSYIRAPEKCAAAGLQVAR